MALPAERRTSSPALILLAESTANLGRLHEAADWCTQAIAADKLDPALHYLQATILLEEGSTREAGEALRRCLYLAPDYVMAHVALGGLCRRVGKPDQATRHFENARTLLRKCNVQQLIPGSEGVAAGRLLEMLEPEAGPAGTERVTGGAS